MTRIEQDELTEFRLDLFENCRENLEKLRISSYELDKNLMHFATTTEFANVKELILNQYSGIDCDELNLPLFCGRRWNLTAIRLDIEDFKQDILDFSPIGSMPHLTELQLKFYGGGSDPLTRQIIESLLNPNLKKLFLSVRVIEDGVFIRIGEICGANLEIFHFDSQDDEEWIFLPSEWFDFLPLCPRLRDLFVDYHREYPTQIWQRRFADLLPNGLEILRRSAIEIMVN